MRNSSGDARLANRLHILQLRQLEPRLGVNALAKRVGVNPSTVRSVLARFGAADISVGSPVSRKGAGRPHKATRRDKRCGLL
jgi:predicted ArsR family transcriptional regulator